MNTANNRLFAAYLSDEASTTGDWLRLSIMLVLLVLARMAQPQPGPAAAVPAPRPARQYLLPVRANRSPLSDSQLTIYNTRYNTQFMLGHLTRH
jgi:hypothetical protein